MAIASPEHQVCQDSSAEIESPVVTKQAWEITTGDSPWSLSRKLLGSGTQSASLTFVKVKNGHITKTLAPTQIRPGDYVLLSPEALDRLKQQGKKRKISTLKKSVEKPINRVVIDRFATLQKQCFPHQAAEQLTVGDITLAPPKKFWTALQEDINQLYQTLLANPSPTTEDLKVLRKQSQEAFRAHLWQYIASLSGEEFHAISGLSTFRRGKNGIDYKNLTFLLYKSHKVPQYRSIPEFQTLYSQIFEQASKRHNVPKKILISVIARESHGDPLAVSSRHAFGLAGLTQDIVFGRWRGKHTWDQYPDINPFSPEESIDRSAEYLSYLYSKFAKDLRVNPNQRDNNTVWDLALTAYNAGRSDTLKAFKKSKKKNEWKKYLPSQEGREYSQRVFDVMQELFPLPAS